MTDQKNDTTTTPTTQVDEVKQMRKFANYMKANVSCATVTFASRKMEAFKGKYFVEQLKKYENGKYKSLGDDAMELANQLLREKYIIKVMKNPDKRADSKNKIIPVRTPDKNTFDPKGRYIWLYEGSTTWRNIYVTILVVGFFFMCLFPIWPRAMKVGVWYLSVTFLLIMIGFIVVRLFVFGTCWIAGYDFWILPNFFDEEASIMQSVTPLYTFEKGGGSLKTRLAMLAVFVAFCVWVYQQPTEFDEYVQAQKDFLDDLYSGALLNDMSQQDIENIDRVIPLEELLQMEEEAKAKEAAAAAAAATDEESVVDRILNEALEEDGDSLDDIIGDEYDDGYE